MLNTVSVLCVESSFFVSELVFGASSESICTVYSYESICTVYINIVVEKRSEKNMSTDFFFPLQITFVICIQYRYCIQVDESTYIELNNLHFY